MNAEPLMETKEELVFVHSNGLQEDWPIKNPEMGRTYIGSIHRIIKPVPHTCFPPRGWGEPGDILTCQICKTRWVYRNPVIGMYPGWVTLVQARRDVEEILVKANKEE